MSRRVFGGEEGVRSGVEGSAVDFDRWGCLEVDTAGFWVCVWACTV